MIPYVSTRPQLVQNAVYLPEKDLYLKSTHVHDYITHTLAGNVEVMLDGGLDYVRRNVHRGTDAARIVDWCLYDNTPFSEITQKFLWGTRGVKGDQPLRWRPIASLDLDHLQAILKTQPQIRGTLAERVIKWWVKEKKV